MQAAMNPLLLSLGLGKPADPAVLSGKGGAETSFMNMFGFADLLANDPQAAVAGPIAEAGTGEQASPLEALIERISQIVEGLTELAESAELPAELTQKLQAAIETLGAFVEQLQTAAPQLEAIAPLAFAGDSSELVTELPNVVALPQNLQGLERGLQNLVSTAAAAGQAPQVQAIGKVLEQVQRLLRPANMMTGTHPVALTPDVKEPANLQVPTSETPEVPVDALVSEESLFADVRSGQPAAGQKPGVHAAVAQIGQATAGAIDIPREMIQVVPQEAANIVQASGDVTNEVRSTEAAQQARPDTPQAKFTQAVVGQLRSVEFKEGTTKVELNPRGLGQVEVELKTNSDGSLSVVVRAENAHVLSSLRSEGDLLAQVIGQSGEASVEFQEFSSDDGQAFAEQAQGDGFDSEAGEGAELEQGDTTPTQSIGNGQLDLTT